MQGQSGASTIARNTVFLYIRMLILMVVSLYTSRVVLDTLGIEDFGIYNVVGGIVVLFTFINNSMVTSTQRYLTYEIGRDNKERTQQIFSISLNLHIIIATIILILSETIGLWFLNSIIQYPPERTVAIHVLYQFSVLTTFVKIIRTPFSAVIISFEKMSFYAYLSVFEALLQLGVVFVLSVIPYDRLIMYGVLLFIVAIIIDLCYYVYCIKNFDICSYVSCKDVSLYKQLLSFSGWSLLGSMANIGANQGLSLMLNVFWGVTVNAAYAIATQVNGAVSSFVSSFQTAFNPQIVKAYAVNDMKYFLKLIMTTSKYSYLLLFVLVLPIYICCPEVLSLWLDEVPAYSVELCRLMLIFSLLDAIQGPLWFSVQATGKIKVYQILMSILILSSLPIAYMCLKHGCSPESVLVVRCLINFITLFVRIWYLKRLYAFPVIDFVKSVLLRIVPITAMASLVSLISVDFKSPFIKIIFFILFTLILNAFLIIIIGMTGNERYVVVEKIRQYYEKYKGYK